MTVENETPVKLRSTDEISRQDREDIFQGLLAYNLPRIEDRQPRDLGIFAEDADGRKLAGLIGETHGNWLTIRYLWVSETLRGRGIGSSILKQAEAAARERGCRYAFLDTFDFQAPEFYRKYGYREVFALNEYPRSGKRRYFTKNLCD